MDVTMREHYGIDDLLEIVRVLRAPGGCPWDREQTHSSIRQNLIEETYEVAEAIDSGDAQLLREELGDLLLQVVMHAQMEAEKGGFTFGDICDGIAQKLVYRHPHVFGEGQAKSTAEVLKNWEALKNLEKSRDTASARLTCVPASLPALMRTQKVQNRADEFGFGYGDVQTAFNDLDSEIGELKDALGTGADPESEAGDILFSAVNVARLLGVDAEEALGKATKRFVGRVLHCEAQAEEAGRPLAEATPQERDAFWRKAKRELAE